VCLEKYTVSGNQRMSDSEEALKVGFLKNVYMNLSCKDRLKTVVRVDNIFFPFSRVWLQDLVYRGIIRFSRNLDRSAVVSLDVSSESLAVIGQACELFLSYCAFQDQITKKKS
jgi:hypothetical protein